MEEKPGYKSSAFLAMLVGQAGPATVIIDAAIQNEQLPMPVRVAAIIVSGAVAVAYMFLNAKMKSDTIKANSGT